MSSSERRSKEQAGMHQESTFVNEERVECQIKSESNKRKRESPYWKHVKRVDTKDANGKIQNSVGVCIYCKEEVRANTKSNGTSSLKHHLEKKCQKSPLYIKSDPSQSTLTNETMSGSLVTHSFNQKRCEAMCVMYIIKDEMPFRAIEGKGFVELVHELQPRFKPPNRKKIASGVWDFFLLEKGKIFSVIGNQRVNLTTDTWTSIQNINYMIVTAHFMDDEWNLHKRIINFTKITSHKGSDIGALLEVCLKEWSIEKVFTITVDNAKSNDGAVDFMSRRFKSKNTLVCDGEYLHLRCVCHILNLIVKDGLVELYSSIEAVRNCVVYIHSSSARLSKFRDFAILEKLDPMANIPLDVATRWNSTFKMLVGAHKYKDVFSRMTDENAPFVGYFNEMVKGSKNLVKRVGPPLDEDWERSQSFVQFLKKIYETTLKLSATKKCTSHLIFTEIVGLQIEIEKKIHDSSNLILQGVAESMKLKFDKYWGSFGKLNKVIYIANVLDPRFKLQMIKISYKNLGYDASKIQMIVDAVKASLVVLYNEYKGVLTSGNSNVSGTMEYDIGVNSIEDDDTQSQLVRDLMQQRKEQQLVEISNEVDKYLADPFENPMIKNFDLLLWWKGNQTRYPTLSKIAKDIFAIPSSTVASENAFSLGRRIVDPFRASLTPRMVEALVCTSDWVRAEEFSFYKEPTDEELTLYKELEELEANLPNGASQESTDEHISL